MSVSYFGERERVAGEISAVDELCDPFSAWNVLLWAGELQVPDAEGGGLKMAFVL